MKLSLCLCGCGKYVSSPKNSYINGHNKRDTTTNEKTKEKISLKLKDRVPWNKGKKKSSSLGIYKQSIKLKELRGDLNSIYNSKEYKNKHLQSMNSFKTKKKISLSSLGRTSPNKGVEMSLEQRKLISITLKNSIEEIKSRYPFFSQLEEMRYNPDKSGEKEIQVHCKNHLCPNSKEQNGWFTPTRIQFSERIRQLESENGNGGSYLYCSEKCKEQCPLFNLKSDPLKETETPYTQEEYQQFREFVLNRDDYKCQYCGEKAKYIHHERPQKLEPFFALDPDLAWSVCEKCHYKYGHKTGTECSTGNLATQICF
jgi:hypothetical protein